MRQFFARLWPGILLLAVSQGCSSKTPSLDSGEPSDLGAAERSVLIDAAGVSDAVQVGEGQGGDLVPAVDMSVNDPDGLLGYRLYADQYGSGNLAIHAVELCLEGVVYD